MSVLKLIEATLRACLRLKKFVGLRRAATENGVSINDLMLSDLFQVVSDWNLRAGHSEKGLASDYCSREPTNPRR